MFFIGPPFGNYIQTSKTISIVGSFTLYPRDGLYTQIAKTLRYSRKYKGWVNKIGLRNKGIDYALANYDPRTVISIAILHPSDIDALNAKIPPHIPLEINVSCPNAEKAMETKGIAQFLHPKRKWCIVKLSPTCTFQQIDQYYQDGFRQFHCSNTMPIDAGGLSGKAVMKENERLITYIKSHYSDVEVIGGGGITTLDDVLYYYRLGADHMAFSTVLFCPYLFGKLYWGLPYSVRKKN